MIARRVVMMMAMALAEAQIELDLDPNDQGDNFCWEAWSVWMILEYEERTTDGADYPLWTYGETQNTIGG